MQAPLDRSTARHAFLERNPVPLPQAWLARLLDLPRLEALYERAVSNSGPRPPFDALLNELRLKIDCPNEALARIPATGPAVVVANHPFGLLEGPILGHLLARVRPDVRFMANSLLAATPELSPHMLAVNPFGDAGAQRENLAALRQSLDWLNSGGLLVIFPAGQVASLRPGPWRIEDPDWKDTAARLILKTGATAVPVYLHGANGAGFHTAGIIHPGLRTALLVREFLNKQGKTISLEVGSPIPAHRLAALASPGQATAYLRSRTLALRWRRAQPATRRHQPPAAPVILPSLSDSLRRDVAALVPSSRLLSASGLEVYLSDSQQIPAVLTEIGRLREITFRSAGEGTRKHSDLDRFDFHYQHLFLWNPERAEIAGAYRLASTSEVLSTRGPSGLYTSTLFDFKPGFFDRLGPAFELGRSFVCAQYQRQFAPLLLLWQGIGRTVARSPHHRTLFGAASISAGYHPLSRQLMVSYLSRNARCEPLWPLARPRRPFKSSPASLREAVALASLINGVADLSDTISELEAGGRALPVLIRHYLNAGGRFAGFNLDTAFSGVVDGLVVVDLLAMDRRALLRHLGSQGAAAFLRLHASVA